MSDNWVEGTLESGADEGGAVADDLSSADLDAGDLDKPTPLSGAELGLQDGEPNSFEPEEADPAVTPDPEDEPEPGD